MQLNRPRQTGSAAINRPKKATPARAIPQPRKTCPLRLAVGATGFLLAVTGMGLGKEFRVIPNKPPHEIPPFTHWDLREFHGCTIPWHLGTAAVPDLDGIGGANTTDDVLLAYAKFAASVSTWDEITPGKLNFVVPAGPGGPTGGFATDGFNTLSFSATALSPGINAATIVDRNVNSGVIREADIVFNSTAAVIPGFGIRRWVLKAHGDACGADLDNPPINNWPTPADGDTDVVGPNNGVQEFEIDLQTVATHELGHFLGLDHISPLGGQTNDANNPVMEELWLPGGPTGSGHANQTVKAQDQDGFNFLYCPDLGDAPHKDDAFSPDFSTNVHGTTGGRVLNWQNLPEPIAGPAHLLGIKPRQPARNFTYEWIGVDVDSECNPNADDLMDDGVSFNPSPPKRGKPCTITVHVQTAGDAYNHAHDYGSTRKMYVNLWVDLNVNEKWEPSERVISDEQLAGPGTKSETVTWPDTASTVWVRARLDWGEHVAPDGFNVPGLSPDLVLHEGAAQFGEVEDHPRSGVPTRGACLMPPPASPNCLCHVSAEECQAAGGTFLGEDTLCPDPGQCIPATSAWGLFVLGLLTVSAGTIVLRRRAATIS